MSIATCATCRWFDGTEVRRVVVLNNYDAYGACTHITAAVKSLEPARLLPLTANAWLAVKPSFGCACHEVAP